MKYTFYLTFTKKGLVFEIKNIVGSYLIYKLKRFKNFSFCDVYLFVSYTKGKVLLNYQLHQMIYELIMSNLHLPTLPTDVILHLYLPQYMLLASLVFLFPFSLFLGRGSNFKKNLLGKPKERRHRKCKDHREMRFFIFIFSYDGN